jgi:hypothetical protein
MQVRTVLVKSRATMMPGYPVMARIPNDEN